MEAGQRCTGTVYYFCNFFESLKLSQIRMLKIKKNGMSLGKPRQGEVNVHSLATLGHPGDTRNPHAQRDRTVVSEEAETARSLYAV